MNTAAKDRYLATSHAFTLIEVLVAIAVLALVSVLMVSMLGNVSSAWTRSKGKMDNFTKGRALVNLLHNELTNAVLRDDLPTFPDQNFAFYTASFAHDEATLATAPTEARPLTFVTYQVVNDPDTNRPVLKRYDQPYFYQATPGTPQWIPATDTLTAPTGTTLDRTLCEGIYAFRYAFLQADGSISDQFSKSPNNPTRAIQVSLAVLSEQAEEVVTELTLESRINDLFNSATTPIAGAGWSPKSIWDARLQDASTVATLPGIVLAGIETYERVIPIQFNPTANP